MAYLCDLCFQENSLTSLTPELTNVKKLVLVSSAVSDDGLLGCTLLLKAFPALQKLVWQVMLLLYNLHLNLKLYLDCVVDRKNFVMKFCVMHWTMYHLFPGF